jgi:serine/threonine-protein kinase
MLATGRAYAEDTYRRVEAILDDRSRAWVAMYVESCEATNVRGDQSAQLLDLRTTCLDRRRDEMKALTTLLAERSDAGVLDRAVQASYALSRLDGCADAEALTAAFPPPADAATRAQVAALRARMSTVKVLDDTGKVKEGLALASQLVEEARASHYPPAEAEALVLLGRLHRSASDAKAAETVLHEAALAAARAKDDAQAAQAWTYLVYVIGKQQGRLAEALALKPVAESAVERAGGNLEDRAILESTLASLAYDRGAYAEAEERHERGRALYEQVVGPDHPRVGIALNNLANAVTAQERFDEAQRLYERSLAIREKAFGPDHPGVAAALTNLGNLLIQQGQHEEALPYVRRALAIFESALGPEHDNVAEALKELGIISTALKRYDEAWASLERSRAIREKRGGPEHREVATCLFHLGSLRDAQGRFAEARAYYERALAIREKSLGPSHHDVAEALSSLGRVLAEQQRYDLSLSHLERALAIDEKAVGPASLAVSTTLARLGACYLEMSQPEKAVAPLERALAIDLAKAKSVSRRDLARVRYHAARALQGSGGDRQRAATLAAEARAAYRADGPSSRRELDEVDGWMKEHGIPPG